MSWTLISICLTLTYLIIIYLLEISKRVLNKDTVLGNIYLVNMYIIIVISKKLNITWFTKKKGINWGIFFYIVYTFFYAYKLLMS